MKRISQRDIARTLGVNVSTVSRALRGLEGVSPDLRQKVVSLAKEQGYRPNPFAMSLRYDTTHTIGIVVPDVSFSHYAHIIKRIEGEARKSGYMCVITDSDDKYDKEIECLEHLTNLHVEGVIVCPSQETTIDIVTAKPKRRSTSLFFIDRSPLFLNTLRTLYLYSITR